ncbi:hypothetical protein [Photorhabdus viridis]|uniref:hypothetical protein n=1 Tax=Photorhabdus viridis TaxID=3163327 RepID=UPI0033070153
MDADCAGQKKEMGSYHYHGDAVEAGKLVASIDDTFYRTKVEASRARLEKLRAMLKEEQYTYELLFNAALETQ